MKKRVLELKEAVPESDPTGQKALNAIRLKLAQWLWPKVVKRGDYFTIIRILQYGKPTNDGSWVGDTLRADSVQGDRVHFSQWQSYSKRFAPVSHVLIPGVNCELKLVSARTEAT